MAGRYSSEVSLPSPIPFLQAAVRLTEPILVYVTLECPRNDLATLVATVKYRRVTRSMNSPFRTLLREEIDAANFSTPQNENRRGYVFDLSEDFTIYRPGLYEFRIIIEGVDHAGRIHFLTAIRFQARVDVPLDETVIYERY